ncbi:MAG TPA: OmpA family protein [Chitinophagaceae bacterium]|nr:OmpA family protein [Chitinophagaceae bacterium]
MKSSIVLLLIAIMPFLAQAQIGRSILNKAKDKINQRIDKKVDSTIDNSLDEIEGKKSNSASPSAPSVSPSVSPYIKFDFIPGEQIIYFNDLAAETLGELPIGWNSNGNGAVVTINGLEGNWVQLYKDAIYLTDNKENFSDNFTVEFDLLMRRSNPKESFPQFAFGVLASGEEAPGSNVLLKAYKKFFCTELKIQPSDYDGSHMHLETFAKYEGYMKTDVKKYGVLEKFFNKPVHISMQVQKERLRVWINENKLYDLPKAIVAGTTLNQLFFFVKGNGGNDDEVGYDISNFKIAKGLPDSRHKLVDEGKFTTTGILFDVNSANIKPESSGVLKDIADVLTKHPDIKVKIIGHTDADGSDQANTELSRKRAAAVKTALAKDFAIPEDRMETDGKGESVPVADNKTKEGKAQNRRVEFIKQ